jgi:hypothetical protein
MILGLISSGGKRYFSFQNGSPTLGPTQSSVQWVLPALFLGLRWPEHEAGHSPTCSAEVRNKGSYTPAPPVCLHDVHSDDFIFSNFITICL